jgi:hypothetical protein
MDLQQVREMFAKAGCQRVYAKVLAENDNSKNQIYFGPNLKALNLLPIIEILGGGDPDRRIVKAPLAFSWLWENGETAPSPRAQLILYPDYPEVRFSGFLAGCRHAPSELLRNRQRNRVLFLGIRNGREILGHVAPAGSPASNSLLHDHRMPEHGVFIEIPAGAILDADGDRASLIDILRHIHDKGWIDSKQLASDGSIKPCKAPQCGGFTLEAELGIPKNSEAKPDFLGWEIKQHHVPDFTKLDAGVITLMTPEPDGGCYVDEGPGVFVRRYGYVDRRGRADRMNFGGIYKIGDTNPLTKLTLEMTGYDRSSNKITSLDGRIILVTNSGEVAASWGFIPLLKHWNRKHAKAAYVPAMCREHPVKQYLFGDRVRLAVGTEFILLLRAFHEGSVYYDPGIKLEHASSPRPILKRRSQFRTKSKDVRYLYDSFETVIL